MRTDGLMGTSLVLQVFSESMGPIKIKTLLIKSYFNSSLIPVYGQREILRLLRKQTEERGERKQEEEGVSSGMIITYFTDEG